MLRGKILLSNLSLFENETIFSQKITSERKKYMIVMNLCQATFRSFVVQWSTNIASRQTELKRQENAMPKKRLDAAIS